MLSRDKGNEFFRQPEVEDKAEDQSKADVWAFGCMVLFLLMPDKLSNEVLESGLRFYCQDIDTIYKWIDELLDAPED